MNVLDDPVITLPIFMEAWMQGFLQMAIITQAVMYYYNPLGDKMSQRLYVGALVALAATQTGLAVFKAIHVIILRQPWSQWPGYFLDVFLNGLICSCSEVWLIRRCWKSTRKNKWVLLGLGSIGFSTCVVNIYLGADLAISRVRGGVISDPLRSDRSPATVFAFDYFIFASFVLDLSMSVILGWNLFRARVGVKYLDQTLMRINLMIWESAVLPWLSMLVAVGLYHARVQNLRNLVLLFLLLTGKLYILGILLALNSRESYRKDMGENQPHGRTSLSGYQWDEEKTLGGSANSSREPRPKNGEVSIHDVLRAGPGAVSETISVVSFLPEVAPSLVQQPSSIKSIKRKPLPPLPRDKDEDFAPVNNFGFANMGSQDLSITDALRVCLVSHLHTYMLLNFL
ncbi:hypothetical protein PENSPDRAFT_176494 [Peniophora sp. CONT]|nr:hypothetical protein PENSPDRAFT_176494 [Peniophora sp. CONT]